MDSLKSIVPLFAVLFICVLDGYSMMNYRLTAKRTYICFGIVSIFCLIVNSYIIVRYGTLVLRSVILFTIGMPYLVLILLITKDSVAKTFFNFWLWINIYGIIANFSAFVNDYTFKNYYFLTVLRLVLFSAYFVLYNKHLKMGHQMIMKKLKVNWWIFSFIPMSFTVLICLVNFYFKDFKGFTRNYPVLLMIFVLMIFVYILIFYTFKTVYDSMERERISQSLKDQIVLQKKQYEFYLQKTETEKIFRHDARHRDKILLNYLEEGQVKEAKKLLCKELTEMHSSSKIMFCANTLINTVLAEYQEKAQKNGLEFLTQIQMPNELSCDETEFCVMLSNLLENSLDSAKSYIRIKIKYLNRQISINIKNDYTGELKKDADGFYRTTKSYGSGLGLKSVNIILKKNSGFLKIYDNNGVFNVFATLKN